MARKTITTSIAYINAEPHIGFLFELVAADVLARYHRLQGDEVFFLTGTDEHGIKIQRSAEAASQEPQEYADKISEKFRQVCTDFNISIDHFVRTTDKAHIEYVQRAWGKLQEKGVIEKRSYEGLYCSGCEAFKTEREINNGKCRIHETELEKVSEENWYLKITDEAKQVIREWLSNVQPAGKQTEVRHMLEDFDGVSVSRPKEKLSWGISVPGDESQVMYVWVDALLNYLSGIEASGRNVADWWPQSTQLIGKDILKFHAIIWPALLHYLGEPLPEKLLVHGFINVDGKKMSKSIGNVVTPEQLKERYGVEATRYLLLRQLSFNDDSNFVWDEFDAIYNGELANGIGNLVSRLASVSSKFDDGLKLVLKQEVELQQKTQQEALAHSPLMTHDFPAALTQINALIKEADFWLTEKKPWEHLREETFLPIEPFGMVLQISFLIEPFMPETAEETRRQLNELDPKALFPRLEKSA